jgi:hypothetical protein
MITEPYGKTLHSAPTMSTGVPPDRMCPVVQPRTLGDLITEVRSGLVCDRCGRYVGSLAEKTYLPPNYPVAVSKEDDEVSALVTFEIHMLERLRRGNFAIRHPQKDGRCVSIREWMEDDETGEDHEPSSSD